MVFARLVEIVLSEGAAALVRVHAVAGSAPREEGACMMVRPDGGFYGTIGGGRLEWDALADAGEALRAGRGPAWFRDYALGPDLGQCCGGRVVISIETFDTRDVPSLEALAACEGEEALELRCSIGGDGRVVRSVA